MNTQVASLRGWWLLSVVCGFCATLSYVLSIFVPFPDAIRILLAFAFGPFLIAAVLGFYRLIGASNGSISLQVGTMFMIAAGILVTLMFIVQQTSFAIDSQLAKMSPPAEMEQRKLIFKEVNAIQLGIDLGWDIFLSTGTFLVALSLWKHPVFKRALPVLGMFSCLVLMVVNLYSFPVPPANAGLIDFGPLVATWWTVSTILILIRRSYFVS